MKKNNKIIIGILITIIICLLIFISLLLSDTISFNTNTKDTLTPSKKVEEDDKEVTENINFTITYQEETEEFKNQNGSVVIINKRNLPIIDNNKENTNKIVNYLTNISNKDWENLKKQSNDYAKEFPDNYNVGVNYLFNTIMNTTNVLTIGYNMEGSMGGVGWLGNWGYNFNKVTGEILNFDDILTNDSAKENLSNYIIQNIEKDNNNNILWDENSPEGKWQDIAKTNMFKLGSWYFTDKGITQTFNKYLLGPGATGIIVVNIPYIELNQYLKVEYRR